MNEEILAELRQQTKLLLQIASDLAEVKENSAASGAINHTMFHVGEKVVNVGARVTELEKPLIEIWSRMGEK